MSNNDKKQAAGLQVFYYNQKQGTPVRVQVINDEPWFVAKDLAKALNVTWNGKTLDAIPSEWKGVRNFLTPGGNQQFVVVNEARMYKFIFRCQSSPLADKITNWVASEVLPSIRKTGSYQMDEVTKKRRISRLPRKENAETAAYFDELTKWVRLEDEKEVAKTFEVTREHVHEVVCGRAQSVTLLDILTGIAMDNRKKGNRREQSCSRQCRERVEELRLEFMEEKEE